MTLENGVEFPLEFHIGDYARLAETFSELATLANTKARH
jgi:hypothetical protein